MRPVRGTTGLRTHRCRPPAGRHGAAAAQRSAPAVAGGRQIRGARGRPSGSGMLRGALALGAGSAAGTECAGHALKIDVAPTDPGRARAPAATGAVGMGSPAGHLESFPSCCGPVANEPALAGTIRYPPGLHPEHPTAEEGCRPASRSLALELMTFHENSGSTGAGSIGPCPGRHDPGHSERPPGSGTTGRWVLRVLSWSAAAFSSGRHVAESGSRPGVVVRSAVLRPCG
jgi:hypothetical protein